TNASSLAVAVTVPAAGVSVNAGIDAIIDEGSLFTRTITFSDGEDAGADGWTYSVNWGDGSSIEMGSIAAGANSFDISHFFADGNAGHDVSVTVTDVAGDSDTQQFRLNVNNVAPTIALSGLPEVDAGVSYTLNLGAITDPGDDTVTSYIVNWGDGSSDTYNTAGEVTHAFAAEGNYTISVDLVDEDGTHTAAGTLAVAVNSVIIPDGVSVNAGIDAVINEGSVFTRTITFSDGEDTGADGWTYNVNWGDGSIIETGNIAAGASSFDISRFFADGDVNHDVSVTVTDVAGDSDTQQFRLNVNNVAPTLVLTGTDSVDEGSAYLLSFGSLVDPGTDTANAYILDWGDGTMQSFTVAEFAALGGSAGHVYSDDGSYTVNLTVTDEDGSFVAGSKFVNVNNVAPTLSIAGIDDINEGSIYVLAITATDPAGAADPLTYSIDWGDGSPLQNLTATELAVLGGNIEHIYADDEDGPVNATPHTITVTADDGDGGVTQQSRSVTVHNVAPTLAISGAASQVQGNAYVLSLGAVTDPGVDTVTSYIVNWGDGNISSYDNAGEVSHIYASTGDFIITVGLIDEDGTHAEVATQAVAVTAPTPTLSFEAGADVTLDEGTTFTRTIVFSDGEDDGAAGWNYTIDYGDGTIDTGITLEQSLELSHLYTDGDATHIVTVTLTDEEGETASDSFAVQVDNVAPVVALSGLPEVDAGVSYTLNLGAITDPGDDTVISYIVNWGDGSSNTYDAAGEVTHTFAAEGNYTISVDLVDEDDTHTAAGTLAVAVNSVIIPDGVSVNAGIDAIIDEGSLFTRTITFADGEDTGADGWTYSVDWGNDSVIETGSIAAGASSFDISRIFADGDAGHDISVTVTDVAGDSDTQQFRLDVNNVAPVIALSGLSEVNAGVSYTLNLGAITDPGDDTVTSYIVNWGDDSSDIYDVAGEVTHTFAAEGNYTISVDLVDEDGTHADAGNFAVTVNEVAPVEVVRIGDAPLLVLRSNPNVWQDAWTDEVVSISHKSDYTNAGESWSSAVLNGVNSSVLAGGDIFGGDLGVSGQSLKSSSISQEIDGTEALRFDLAKAATGVTVDLSRLEGNTEMNQFDAGRLQLLDDSGLVVNELVFSANMAGHEQQVTLEHSAGFSSVVLTAGIYEDGQFIFGGLADTSGAYQSSPVNLGNGSWDGSDYLVSAIEFEFGNISLVGVQGDLGLIV
ncbi:MAG TPA: PKD domain-containing protein, partial [Nitrosomonas europaea]